MNTERLTTSTLGEEVNALIDKLEKGLKEGCTLTPRECWIVMNISW